MSSYQYSSKKGTYPMPVRDFWNLAGRVGRAGQKSLGWVGIISKDEQELLKISNYVKSAVDELQSQLIELVKKALENPVESEIFAQSSNDVSAWLNSLDSGTWESVRPLNSVMTGTDYRRVWNKLNGGE